MVGVGVGSGGDAKVDIIGQVSGSGRLGSTFGLPKSPLLGGKLWWGGGRARTSSYFVDTTHGNF